VFGAAFDNNFGARLWGTALWSSFGEQLWQLWQAGAAWRSGFARQLRTEALKTRSFGEQLRGLALERNFGGQLSVATLWSSFREPLWRIALGRLWGTGLKHSSFGAFAALLWGTALGSSCGEPLWGAALWSRFDQEQL